MEVVYIYMKDFLGLKEKEYNFHENYTFLFDKELKKLLLKENNMQIPKRFFGRKINSVNAIIGENGKGKTRILDFIYRYSNGNKEWKGFEKEKLYEINKFINRECEIEYIIILKGKNENFYIKSNSLKDIKKQNLSKTKTFYYSNIFDYTGGITYEYFIGGNYQNISVTEVIKKSFKDFINDKEKNKLDINLFLNEIKIKNDRKQIEFIKDLQENYKDFYEELKKEISIPENIILYSPTLINERLEEKYKKELKEEYQNLREKQSKNMILENKQEIKILEEDKRYSMKEIFKKYFIISLLTNKGEANINLKKVNETAQKISDILVEIDSILDTAKQISLGDIINFAIDIKYVDKILELEKRAKNTPGLKNVLNIRKLLEVRKDKMNILNYSWEIPLSSGEKGMLMLFSRLHELLKNDNELENLILLIDELDATFHPEWQRKALDLLIRYLNNYSEYIKSNLTSQLIISSHSPFLIADLPKEKIIALENDGSQKDNKKLFAFGSNILDIYKQNFFLTSTFGEFAKGKITDVIEMLSKGEEYRNLSKDKKNEIKFIIDSIGEPLIKNKLEKMYLELEKEDPVQKIKKLMKEKGITLEDLKEGEI